MVEQKVSVAVDGCLAAIATEVEGRKGVRIREFIASLRARAGLSYREILDVKSRVTQSLIGKVKSLVYPAMKALRRTLSLKETMRCSRRVGRSSSWELGCSKNLHP